MTKSADKTLAMNKYYSRKPACIIDTCFLRQKPHKPHGFTLIELVVVILIVSILASVAIPIITGRIFEAKWSEANAAAGTIRIAVSTYVACNGLEDARTDLVNKSLDDTNIQAALGFKESDLLGTYFVPGDFTITEIDDYGHAVIEVEGSLDIAPEGKKTLGADGSWE
jgi:prepilin-type N-terminal cleavage/methylation domain-containing protein